MTKRNHNIIAKSERLFYNGDYTRAVDGSCTRIKGTERRGYCPGGLASWTGEGLHFLVSGEQIYKLFSGKDTGHEYDNVEV